MSLYEKSLVEPILQCIIIFFIFSNFFLMKSRNFKVSSRLKQQKSRLGAMMSCLGRFGPRSSSANFAAEFI